MADIRFEKRLGSPKVAPTPTQANSFYYKKDAANHLVGWLTDTGGTPISQTIAYLDWSFTDMVNQPTSISGYGITDAYTKTQIDNITGDLGNLTTNNTNNLVAAINELNSAVADGMKPPNPIDCSTNPPYPAANAGETWKVTKGGKVGGANGKLVKPGDMIIAMNDSPGGSQATAGGDFFIVNTNIDSATESVEGTGRIATTQEIANETNDFAWVTPLKLGNKLDSYYTKSYLQGKDFWNITNSDKTNWDGKAELSDIKNATISFKLNGATVSGNFTTNQGTDETIDLGTTSDTQLSDEEVQDIIGGILSNEFTYDDATPSISINSIVASKITEDSTHRFVTDTQISNWNAAEVNVKSNWNATSGDAEILNKPTKLSDFINDIGTFYTDEKAQDAVGNILSTEFTYDDTNNKISINSIDWSKLTGVPNTIVHSGEGNAQLNNDAGYITSASLPTVNNNQITLTAGIGLSGGGTFKLNQNTNKSITFNADVKTSDLFTVEQAQDAVGNILSTDFIYNDVNPGISIDTTKIATRNWVTGKGYLTTETDPVFNASPAGGITNADISNWDSKAELNDINNPTITLNANNGLTGGGNFTLNQSTNEGLGFSIDPAYTGFNNYYTKTESDNKFFSQNDVDNPYDTNSLVNTGGGFLFINPNGSTNLPNLRYGTFWTGFGTSNTPQLWFPHGGEGIYYRVEDGTGMPWSTLATQEWVTAQNYLTQSDLSSYALKSTTLTAGTGLTGGGTLAADRTFNVNFGTAAGTVAQGNDSRINNGQTAYSWGDWRNENFLKTESDTLDSVVERKGVTDKAITINSMDINSRFKKVVEPNVSGGYSRIAFEITDKDIVDDSTTTSLYFGVLGTNKQNKKYTYISRGTYDEDKMALKFDVDNAKVYYESMNTGINLPISSTEIATIGDIANSAYTDEQAQDAVGSILSNEFTYDDPNNGISINSIAVSKITGLATVATSGSYNDLTNTLTAGASINIDAQNKINAAWTATPEW